MPITVIASEGVFSETAEQALFADLTQSFLARHDLTGNKFLEPNVIGEVSVIPKGKSYAGGKPADIVIIELKVPSFALGTDEQKAGFIGDATAAVLKASGGRVARESVYVNMVNTTDGLWGIGGKAYSNQALLEAVGAA
jgi:hypothetical protein